LIDTVNFHQTSAVKSIDSIIAKGYDEEEIGVKHQTVKVGCVLDSNNEKLCS
jgi:hypothetical protein